MPAAPSRNRYFEVVLRLQCAGGSGVPERLCCALPDARLVRLPLLGLRLLLGGPDRADLLLDLRLSDWRRRCNRLISEGGSSQLWRVSSRSISLSTAPKAGNSSLAQIVMEMPVFPARPVLPMR